MSRIVSVDVRGDPYDDVRVTFTTQHDATYRIGFVGYDHPITESWEYAGMTLTWGLSWYGMAGGSYTVGLWEDGVLVDSRGVTIPGAAPPPPECTEGETKCEGYDYYQCINGKWTLIESNSDICGYVPPTFPSVSSNSLSVDKTSGYTGDVFHFTNKITVGGEGSAPLKIIVYADDVQVNTFTRDIVAPTTITITFDLTFKSPGVHTIYTEAFI